MRVFCLKYAFFYLFITLISVNFVHAQEMRKNPAVKNGQEVKTDYFTLIMPKGWSVLVAPQKMPNDGLACVFASSGQEAIVSINIMKSEMSAKQTAEATIESMKKDGLKTGTLEEKDGFWIVSVNKGDSPGKAWFGMKNGYGSVTIVTGKDPAKANELFSVLKPIDKGLFPSKIN